MDIVALEVAMRLALALFITAVLVDAAIEVVRCRLPRYRAVGATGAAGTPAVRLDEWRRAMPSTATVTDTPAGPRQEPQATVPIPDRGGGLMLRGAWRSRRWMEGAAAAEG